MDIHQINDDKYEGNSISQKKNVMLGATITPLPQHVKIMLLTDKHQSQGKGMGDFLNANKNFGIL